MKTEPQQKIKMTKNELFNLYQKLTKFLLISPLKKDKKEIKKIIFKIDKSIWG